MTKWRDVLGVLKVQDNLLDFDHLVMWGKQLGLSEWLGQAFLEAGL